MTKSRQSSIDVLTMQSISKEFPGVKALQNVDFDLQEGEVHAIVGANGAGKSTLINILGGIYSDYTGVIGIEGNETKIHNPHKSKQLGISLLTQEPNLVRELSISDNIFLGREPILVKWGGLIDHKAMIEKCVSIFKSFAFHADPQTKVADISPGACQFIALIKALVQKSRIIILDEPTAALTAKERSYLFDSIKRLSNQKISVILVSHRFEDIFEISNRVTVLRDGKNVFEAYTEEISRNEISFHMLGKDLVKLSRVKINKTSRLFAIQNIEGRTLRDVSFDLSEGESIGIIGRVGSGKEELLRIICGIDKMSSGKIFFKNCETTIKEPQNAINSGIVFLSEDRRRDGLFSLMNVADNITMPYLKDYSRMGVIDSDKVREITSEKVSSLGIKVSDVDQPVAYLSGGNQQKVILARLLCNSNAKLFILEEPTKGIDVGARAEIYSIITDVLKKGNACIVSSSDLDELMLLCDRIILLDGGGIKKILNVECVKSRELLDFVMGSEENV